MDAWVSLLYLDDILVHAKTSEQEMITIQIISDMFKDTNLKMNLKKCELFLKEVTYFRHISCEEGISTHKAK